jgi:hypothetical protein
MVCLQGLTAFSARVRPYPSLSARVTRASVHGFARGASGGGRQLLTYICEKPTAAGKKGGKVGWTSPPRAICGSPGQCGREPPSPPASEALHHRPAKLPQQESPISGRARLTSGAAPHPEASIGNASDVLASRVMLAAASHRRFRGAARAARRREGCGLVRTLLTRPLPISRAVEVARVSETRGSEWPSERGFDRIRKDTLCA